ncbi:hypothetical protein E4T38_05669 [Aureobasidium subglaciale]|nr:hypothetical protein E4T38_05669 [Aureobasidium subglaciale]KAI5221112.1 hypothetical protein E4T40_05693 [Aureobasidium subglaciale]KAI5224317.1 hypothetical protein E4T41_05648 [Aureobasidium subglaciale]KAI5261009.1 hypothetical protein E4T46_05423 [Aureobasidium subglaciale]
MSNNYIQSAMETMLLVRHISTHLAAEPNLPGADQLTRGEVDAWIRALDTGIPARVIDLISLPVLESLLYMRDTNIRASRHLRRTRLELPEPVIEHPWIREDVTLAVGPAPWMPGDKFAAKVLGSNTVSAHEHEVVRITTEDDGSAFIMTYYMFHSELNVTQQDDPDVSTIVHGIVGKVNIDANSEDETMVDLSPDTLIDTIMQTVQTELDRIMPEAPELQQTRENSVEPSFTEIEDDTRPTSVVEERSTPEQDDPEKIDGNSPPADVDEDADPEEDTESDDGPERLLWCVCNGFTGRLKMIECENHRDPDMRFCGIAQVVVQNLVVVFFLMVWYDNHDDQCMIAGQHGHFNLTIRADG